MKYKYIAPRYILLLPIIAVLLLGACREEEEPIVEEEVEEVSRNASINNWIQEEMDIYYLWLDNMRNAGSKEQEPEDYFEKLLFRPTDRFSAIFQSATELTDGLGGTSTEAGYEFGLFTTATPGQVIAEVTYIKRGSPAQNKDIQRGDVITAINGQNMTVDNYRALLREIRSPHTISYRRFDAAIGSFTALPDLQMEVARVSENPNFLDTVLMVDNQKIGYVVYHFFSPSATPQTQGTPPIYDQEMDEIFQRFKSEGVNHLIVDFRYNSGGYVSSAVNLASLIAPNISSSEVFSKTKFNSFLMSFDNLRNVQTRFRDKPENIGAQLGGKVYILTSRRTASASELIINSLRPYMDVIIIGERTTGKNVGSIVIEEEDNPENNYGLLPIVSQSFNSRDQSDYGNGFVPNVEAREATERLRPFGDVNEILLSTAIGQITGTPPAGRFEILDRRDLGNTIDAKIRSGVMIEDVKLDKQ
jgi:carboxyl-terminal processing protease